MNTYQQRELNEEISSIHNFYESLVIQEANEQLAHLNLPAHLVADVICLALNQLPPRYIRHKVDMYYYLSNEERAAISLNIKQAITEARNKINAP